MLGLAFFSKYRYDILDFIPAGIIVLILFLLSLTHDTRSLPPASVPILIIYESHYYF
jgi:hypothetical protein